MKRQYHHLTPEDRLKLYELLLDRCSVREMADRLGYHISTLYRELARHSTKIGYRPDIANQKSTLRRRQGYNLKLEVDQELRCYVIEKLKERWSPVQISGRLAKERGYSVISHEFIYQFIYSQSGKDLQLYKYLRKKRSHRYPKIGRRARKKHPDKVSIHQRDTSINERSVFGHSEGDLILFRKTSTNLFTLRERKTRLLIAIKNQNRQAHSTSKVLIRYMKKKDYPINSLTVTTQVPLGTKGELRTKRIDI
jgi:IS30 family transposase